MRNIFILLLVSSFMGCQTQESAYRMSIKDSLYRDDSLLAINVLQQLNAREKGDSTSSDSGQVANNQRVIKLFTLTNDFRYPKEESEVLVDTSKVDSSAIEVKEAPNTTAAVKTKPKTTPVSAAPVAKPIAPKTAPVAPVVTPPAAKTPSPAPVPAKVVETPKPSVTPTTPPPAAAVKQ